MLREAWDTPVKHSEEATPHSVLPSLLASGYTRKKLAAHSVNGQETFHRTLSGDLTTQDSSQSL